MLARDDRRQADAAQQLGAFRNVPRRHDLGDFRGNAAHQDTRLRLDDGDLGAALAGACRELEPDEAAADDRDVAAGQQMVADRQCVGEGPEIGDAVAGLFGERQAAGIAPVASSSFS